MDKIAALSEILAHNPGDAFARYGLALAYAAENRNDEAEREFNQILATNADYVPAYQMSAQLLLKQQRSDDARNRLTTGLAAAQRTGNAHAASELQAMLDDLA